MAGTINSLQEVTRQLRCDACHDHYKVREASGFAPCSIEATHGTVYFAGDKTYILLR